MKYEIKKKVINTVGCIIAKQILSSTQDGLVVKRKGGAEQIIKVFSLPTYTNIIRPAIRRAKEGPIRVGDVVTDEGYYRETVVTQIYKGWFNGYSLKDGQVFSNLDISKFKRIVGHVDTKIEWTGDE